MQKHFIITLLFIIFISGCVKNNRIDFTTSETFFSSLNEKKIIKKENLNKTLLKSDPKNNKIEDKNKLMVKKSLLSNLQSHKKILKQKFDHSEYEILKVFNEPSLQIKHGKIKNLQFHLKSCHLDLFFLYEEKTYKLKHFDIRPPSMLSSLNEKDCVKELDNNFNLTPGPK